MLALASENTHRDLSVIIPTYNRPHYILRAAKYWQNSQFTVHIVDGSDTRNDALATLSMNSNINYIWSPISLHQRLQNVCSLIDTPFSVMCGDDEFLLTSSLSKIITILKQDKSLVACGGQCVTFKVTNQSVSYKREYHHFQNRQNLSDDVKARLLFHFQNYTPSNIYSVMRSDVWRQAIHICTSQNYAPYDLDELLFEAVVVINGKTKCLADLYWLRSQENAPIRASQNNSLITADWWKSEEYKEEVTSLLRSMPQQLDLENDDLIGNDFIKYALSTYSNWWQHKVATDSQPHTPPKKSIFDGLLSLLPQRDVDLNNYHALDDIDRILHVNCSQSARSDMQNIETLLKLQQ